MFCPKCGKQVPDGAQFCGGCGNQLAKAAGGKLATQPGPGAASQPRGPVQQVQPSVSGADRSPVSWQAPAPTPTAAASGDASRFATAAMPNPSATQAPNSARTSSLTPLSIIARVSAVAALVCMLLPWLAIPALNTLGSWGSLIGLDTAKGDSYTMFALGEAIDAVNSIAKSSDLSTTYTMFLVAWAAALLAIVAGLIVSFVGKRSVRPLIVGAALATMVALAWLAMISTINAQLASQLGQLFELGADVFEVPPAVLLTAFFGIVTIVLSALSKPAAR